MDYREATLTGSKWRRCNLVTINNPAEGQGSPVISFIEQEVLSLGDDTMYKQVGNINVAFDPEATINLYDPATLQPTGDTITHAQLYGMLFGAYMTAAAARDAAEQSPPV